MGKRRKTMIESDNSMDLVVTCHNCGDTHCVNVNAEKYFQWKEGGVLIQNAFPDMSADNRELLISMTCGKCWDEMFGGFEDEETVESC
jgi:RNase P subunit RPR2